MSLTADRSSIATKPRRRSTLSAPEASEATVLVIQRGDAGGAGLLGTLLRERGLSHRTIRIDRGERLPAPGTSALVLLLGSDDLTLTARPEIIDWAAKADRAGTQIFATGTGAHALARALGGDCVPAGRAHRGWITVASADPELISSGPWFAWGDRPLVAPPGAQVLATAPSGAQAFSLNGHIGVHFHPQATPELVREWVTRAPEALDHQGLDEATVRDFPAAEIAARRLLGAVLDGLGAVEPEGV